MEIPEDKKPATPTVSLGVGVDPEAGKVVVSIEISGQPGAMRIYYDPAEAVTIGKHLGQAALVAIQKGRAPSQVVVIPTKDGVVAANLPTERRPRSDQLLRRPPLFGTPGHKT
jgi:hypothetical protein